MTYDPLDTNETDTDADGALTIDDLTATTIAGLDTSSGSGNAQILTDGEGGLIAEGYNVPVAFDHLIAWYPFDSATYGGNNADDVTGGENYYGDSTAYDGTVNGATYQLSGGVTDIDAGANSGAFEFDGVDDDISRSQIPLPSDKTMMYWVNHQGGQFHVYDEGIGLYYDNEYLCVIEGDGGVFDFFFSGVSTTNQYLHVAAVIKDNDSVTLYINGIEEFSGGFGFASSDRGGSLAGFSIGSERGGRNMSGKIDDVRIYNTDLSASQINQIYQNTKP